MVMRSRQQVRAVAIRDEASSTFGYANIIPSCITSYSENSNLSSNMLRYNVYVCSASDSL